MSGWSLPESALAVLRGLEPRMASNAERMAKERRRAVRIARFDAGVRESRRGRSSWRPNVI